VTQSAELPPLLDTLTARLEEAGNERSDAELVAVGHAHAWRSDKKLPERSRALARESVYDWEKRTRSSAGTSRVLTEAESRLLREKAEHRLVLAEGLLDVLRDRDEAVRGRGAEHARKFLRVEETDVSALRSLLDEQVRIERLILSAVPKLEEAVSAGGGGGSPGAGLTGRGHGGRDPVAKALAATGQSRGGHPLGGAPGEAGPNQAFEQLHPRGRGGEWIQKGEGYGKQGPSPRVQQLQARLRELGFQVNSDGQFGVHTEEAVKAFQRKYGLQETGKVDASTVEALRNPPPETARQARGQVATAAGGGKKKGAATGGSRSSRSGRRGSSGSRSSGTSASTGTGAGTSAITLRPGDSKGIEQFQRSHGLKVDGKMGPETKAALEAVNRDRASRGGGTSRSGTTRGGGASSASGASGGWRRGPGRLRDGASRRRHVRQAGRWHAGDPAGARRARLRARRRRRRWPVRRRHPEGDRNVPASLRAARRWRGRAADEGGVAARDA
jgi:peptidoglycan hydrolase-like protein with peptidoglycan-binding domain